MKRNVNHVDFLKSGEVDNVLVNIQFCQCTFTICRFEFVDISTILRKFNDSIAVMRKIFCSKDKFPLSFDGEYDLTYVGHTRYDKGGNFKALSS